MSIFDDRIGPQEKYFNVDNSQDRTNQMLRLEAIKLAVQIKSTGPASHDTRAVIRSAHGIYDFIKTGNKANDD